jgi:hypothetical protein
MLIYILSASLLTVIFELGLPVLSPRTLQSLTRKCARNTGGRPGSSGRSTKRAKNSYELLPHNRKKRSLRACIGSKSGLCSLIRGKPEVLPFIHGQANHHQRTMAAMQCSANVQYMSWMLLRNHNHALAAYLLTCIILATEQRQANANICCLPPRSCMLTTQPLWLREWWLHIRPSMQHMARVDGSLSNALGNAYVILAVNGSSPHICNK